MYQFKGVNTYAKPFFNKLCYNKNVFIIYYLYIYIIDIDIDIFDFVLAS